MDETNNDKHQEGDSNKLQASINKLKGTVLEKGVVIRELNEVNVRLASHLMQSQQLSNVWMITACVMTVMVAVSGWVYLP